MMKTRHFFCGMMLAMGAMALTACSSSDDNNGGSNSGSISTGQPVTLDQPAYKTESALFQISSSSSDLRSIELTEAGNYVIVKKSAAAKAMVFDNEEAANAVTSPWSAEKTRANSNSDIICGTYTKQAENTYVLEGFGTIVVTKSGSNAASLQITPQGGTAYTLQAAIKQQYADSEATGRLCRTWNMTAIRLTMNGSFPVTETQSEQFSYDKTVSGGDLPGLMYDFYEKMMTWAMGIQNRYAAQMGGQTITQAQLNQLLSAQKEQIYKSFKSVQSVIFTQAGTYMVSYGDQSLAVATWAWTNASTNMLRYSWNYGNMNVNGKSGECQMEFSANNLIMTETQNMSATDGIDNMNMKITYQLTEAK